MRRAAVCSSLSSRAKSGDILVVDDLDYKEPKTKNVAELLSKLDTRGKKVLLVLDKTNPAVVKSARNIPGVRVTLGRMLNAYEVLWAEKVIFTQSAVAAMEEGAKNE
jgi:large subunit ribosomal protein L4